LLSAGNYSEGFWIATLKKIIKEIQIKDIQELKSAIAAAGIKSGSAIHQP